jgi:hypothetical protein
LDEVFVVGLKIVAVDVVRKGDRGKSKTERVVGVLDDVLFDDIGRIPVFR